MSKNEIDDSLSLDFHIKDLLCMPELISMIRSKIYLFQQSQAQRIVRKIGTKQGITLDCVQRDIVGSGEKFRSFCHKHSSHQIINTIRHICLHWNEMESHGYSLDNILRNIKYYLGELGGTKGRDVGEEIGIFTGSNEDFSSVEVNDVECRLYAQYFLDNLFSYGTGDNPVNEISFDLLSKLGIQDVVSFFQGTNTDKYSQFDFVVMGIFDAIRREVFIADTRKKAYKQVTNIDAQKRLSESDGKFTEKYKSSIQLGLEGRYSEIAQKNIEYYIGVLQLLFKFSREQGEDGFSVNSGEYFEQLFIHKSSDEKDADLIHELGQAKYKVKTAFGEGEKSSQKVIRLHPTSVSTSA